MNKVDCDESKEVPEITTDVKAASTYIFGKDTIGWCPADELRLGFRPNKKLPD